MIPLMSGVGAPGRQCKELQGALSLLAGGAIRDATYMYEGLSEAMSNVSHHAYPPTATSKYNVESDHRWWASGSFNKDAGNLKVLILDLGVGIPATLPRSGQWEAIRHKMPARQEVFRDDAELIKTAMQTYRTQTEESNRGRGLVQMSEYVDQSIGGFMKVLSGMGEVQYLGRERFKARPLSVHFGGTFIEWEVSYA
tara:strand:- start:2564 stop:3154 length:591 start_codon:yes stop_codon:yes gene_type:complete